MSSCYLTSGNVLRLFIDTLWQSLKTFIEFGLSRIHWKLFTVKEQQNPENYIFSVAYGIWKKEILFQIPLESAWINREVNINASNGFGYFSFLKGGTNIYYFFIYK